MDDTLNKIKSIDSSVGPQVAQFGKYEEEAIISLAIDLPEFFTSVGRFMKPNMFQRLECQVVMAEILNNFEKHNIVPSRNLLKDRILAILTEDDPYESILAIIDRKSNYREVPIIKESLLKWAKDKAFGQIYSEEAQNAYVNGDYEFLESIIQDANRIADVGKKGFWFFDNYQLLFQQDIVDHRTTGFPKLDKILNNGGPSKKEVVCWLAPTNVGKCHTLNTKILEKRLSNIFKLELEDGKIIELAGYRKIQTARGVVRVCDLTDEDDITEIPTESDGDIDVSDVWIRD